MTVGVVVIGRNEGKRLVACVDSLATQTSYIVYVDSGSTDDSVAEAAQRGAAVVQLDTRVPFTAARARNAGALALLETHPDLKFLQFVDGDCQVDASWLATGKRFLEEHRGAGIVWGRQSERFPERSKYNFLFDVEWSAPFGKVASSTGNLMCSAELFVQLTGFREDLIAGEDPEFCLRARKTGREVWHIDFPMVIHDANMMYFHQWWRRARRGGFAFAEGATIHGLTPERHFVKEVRSAALWGFGVPFATALSTAFVGPFGLSLLLVYPLQIARLADRGPRSGRDNLKWAAFVVLAKIPEALGILEFGLLRLLGRNRGLIEYK